MVAFHFFLCLRNVHRQIATSSDMVIIQKGFQIGLQNVSQVQILWVFCNKALVIWALLVE